MLLIFKCCIGAGSQHFESSFDIKFKISFNKWSQPPSNGEVVLVLGPNRKKSLI